jgi:hypothetical protein
MDCDYHLGFGWNYQSNFFPAITKIKKSHCFPVGMIFVIEIVKLDDITRIT